MAKLLYVEASPRKDRSVSIAVAKEFVASYLASHPGDTVETLDVWNTPLPEFNGAVINAKYAIMHGQPYDPADAAAWSTVERMCEHFKSFDKFLFSTPMWNFGIPYKLKHYIDVITQPGLTFTYAPETGYTGLVSGKPSCAIYSRGGAYPAGTAAAAFDLQKGYLPVVLGLIGFKDVKSVVIEPTAAAPDAVAAEKQKRIAEARAMAMSF